MWKWIADSYSQRRTEHQAETPERNATTRSLDQRQRKWLEWMLTTSIPLVHLDAADLPIGAASGCFIDYRGRRFLLSVQHAIERGASGWVVHLGNNRGDGSTVFALRDFNYVGEIIRGSGSLRPIDFCYTEVPHDLVSTYRHATPRATMDERPRHVFATDLTDVPSAAQIYAFAGQTKAELHGSTALVGDMIVWPGLRYLHSEGEFHIFQLPVKHPGHQEFKGCSGAPIVDVNRTLVAIVCGGDTATNTIRGISVARYKFALDFVVGPADGG